MNLAVAMQAPSAVSASERLALSGILATFIALNVVTASISPTVWIDEVLYTDPAYRLSHIGEFTSSAWFHQAKDRFFAGNVPLYSVILAGWIKLVGFNVTAVRSLNYVLMGIAVWIAHSTSARAGLLRTASSRLTFALLLLLSYGMAMAYRWGRPDALTFLIAGAAAWCLTMQAGIAKWYLLAFSAALAVTAGLQLAPYFALATLALLFRFRKSAIADASAIAIGGLVGVVALLQLYASHEVLADFRTSVLPHTGSGGHDTGQWLSFSALYKQDWSLLPILFLAGAICLVKSSRFASDRRNLAYLIAFALAVPPLTQLAGKYPNYYCWMAFAPAAAAACAGLEQSQKWMRICAVTVFAGAMLMGLPARLALAALQFEARDYRPVEAFVRSRIGPEDVVFCDYAPYYPARTIAREVHVQPNAKAMTPEQFREVTVVLGNSTNELLKSLPDPDAWRPTGAVHEWKVPGANSHAVHDRLMRSGAVKYHIVEYRRIKPEARP